MRKYIHPSAWISGVYPTDGILALRPVFNVESGRPTFRLLDIRLRVLYSAQAAQYSSKYVTDHMRLDE